MMNFHVLTLFPEMVLNGLNTSITGKAVKKGLINIEATDIRNYSRDKHNHVDDYPYGGGAGMVMQPMPVYDAYIDAVKNMNGTKRVIYLTPQGKVFNQRMAEEFAKEENLIFLCGHYEGIDEHVSLLVRCDIATNLLTEHLGIAVNIEVPSNAPAVVPMASLIIASFTPGISPFSFFLNFITEFVNILIDFLVEHSRTNKTKCSAYNRTYSRKNH